MFPIESSKVLDFLPASIKQPKLIKTYKQLKFLNIRKKTKPNIIPFYIL